MAKLVCQAGPSAGHEYPLTKEVSTLGRQSTCDIQVMDHMASRQHCQVRKEGRLYVLVDLGSRNGTKLNNKKVTERQLAYGDHIRIGECEWLLVKEAGDVELKDLLSKYELGDKIGEGGMGVVYKAVQRSMARTVALKILSPKYSTRPRFVQQFIKEARAAGQLNHPNIIQVHDVGSENDIQYFSMEFVDGWTCMQLLRANGSFPIPEALEITRQVAKALEYAHEHRLIHQDIKPDNIMIGSNNLVKVADLGISKTFDEADHDDGPKRVMGTPHYMAPEAALGKKIDHRVDLYSLGATLYHLLTGKTPYTGTSATEVLKAQVMDPLPAIQDINPDAPDEVCALVERLMAKKPEDRYQSATEVLEEVKRLLEGGGLAKGRIAGGETMILQRLAKGVPTGGGIPTPGDTGTGKGLGTATPELGETGTDLETRRLRLVFALGVLALVILLLFIFKDRILRPAPGSDHPAGGEPARTIPSDPGQDLPPAVTQDPGHASQLDQIERTMRSNPEASTLGELLATVDRILGENPPPGIQARADRVRVRITADLADHQRAQHRQAFNTLEAEVDKLVAERNFDLALNRLGAFQFQKDPDLQAPLDSLRAEIDREKTRYLGDLGKRIDAYVARNDGKGLGDLRNQLPAALLGSALEKRIQTEIARIAQETEAKNQGALRDIASSLVLFDTSKVEERHRLTRPAFGDGPSGAEADAFLACAQELPALVAALDAAPKASEARKIHFVGEIGRIPGPSIVGATRSGLVLAAPAGSGEIEVAWKNIDLATLREVVVLLTGKQSDQWNRALEVLARARSLTGP